MTGWLVIEDTQNGWVDVLNVGKIVALQVVGPGTPTELLIQTQESNEPWYYLLRDLAEFETLINLLASIEDLGWIHIVDGRVQTWRGKLKLLSNAEEGQQ